MNKVRKRKKGNVIDKPFIIAAGFILLFFILPLAVMVSQKQQTIQQNAQAGTNPLICGTNLTLNDANDQFITSQATRTALQSIHVQLIRMPIRSVGGPSSWEVQAMQDIKALGATPMIVLKYTQTDPAGAAKLVIQQANSIFGTGVVYYEFGNERDLAGVDQTAYTTSWNQIISQVKATATNGRFGGPVNFQQNPTYIAYFVHNATPKPDFISWHEYTCGNGSDPQTVCIGHIANWKTHIANTKAAIQANGDIVPPIFITEWNYDPNNPSPDSRATPQFQQQFTQTALQELANDGVTGATHYVATGHTEYNLVDPSGNLTPEGTTFGQMCSQLTSGTPTIGGGQGPTVAPTLSAAPQPTSITPPVFCVGGNGAPPCATIAPTAPITAPPITNPVSTIPVSSPTPSTGGGISPTTPNVSMSPAPTTVSTNPSPGTGNGGNNGFLQQLLNLIKQLLNLLLQLFGTNGNKHGNQNNNQGGDKD